MNKDKKTIIGALVILVVLLGIIGGLIEYHTAKVSQVINESFSIISDNMSVERQKEIRLSQLDGYDNVQEWLNDLLTLKSDFEGSADAAVDSYGDFLSDEEIDLLHEYENNVLAAESITQASEQIDLFDALVNEKAALAQPYYGGYSYNSYYYTSDNEEGNLSAKEWIAWRESGGDYNARNGQYIGRYQLSADKLDGDWSPEHQEEVADDYVANRYGSWEAAKEFWEAHGWY